jgi:hypothetical protein
MMVSGQVRDTRSTEPITLPTVGEDHIAISGLGWFPIMCAYGAKAEFFNDDYKYSAVNKDAGFSKVVG